MKKLIYILVLFFTPIVSGQTHNFWTKKNDFGGLKRERAVAFTANNFAFVGTGVDTAEHVLNDLWKYDSTTDSWEQVADLPGSVRRNAVAFSINDIGYVGTGIDSANAGSVGSDVLTDFWAYDPAINTWTQKADFPGSSGVGIYFATAFTVDSKGYVCGGKRGPNNYTDELWEYKPSIDQWAQLDDFPGGVRYQLSSFSIGSKGFVGLGTDQDYYRNDIWQFETTTNQWTQKSNFPASERASAMTFTIADKGYICLGNNGGVLGDLWEYNVEFDQWSVKANYGGSSRKNAVAFTLNGKGYVGTGKGFSGKKASFHEYTPSDLLSVDTQNQIELSIYPNPSTDFINVHSSTIGHTYQVINQQGKIVIQSRQSNIAINHLKPGNYYLKIDKPNSTIQKFVKL